MAKRLHFERIEIPNNGFMSDQPTNGFIIGTDEVIIVDPGDEAGAEIFLNALADRGNPPVKAIVLTHSHPDHAIAAARLKRELGCPVMLNPKEQPILEQFKGLTWDQIDQELHGGMTIEVDGGVLEAIDTPGHAPGHIALFERESGTLIAGDLVSGHGTVGIFPPHGKMSEYFDSLRVAEALHPNVVYPGHGPTITNPEHLFEQYIERRSTREREIVDELRKGPATIDEIVPPLYPDVLPHFRRAAGATVLAHLIKLETEGRVTHDGEIPMTATWSIAESTSSR
ncbi:MAG TPA: MBL fold metallo-hydrolase [Nitrolancea sp.]|nr:MBL fold metallo-hydrolase [Nitrolancea sp.]